VSLFGDAVFTALGRLAGRLFGFLRKFGLLHHPDPLLF
jgi:hypothetical protein